MDTAELTQLLIELITSSAIIGTFVGLLLVFFGRR